MNRPQAIKYIYYAIREIGYGLKKAVDIYEYLSGGGVIPVTEKDVFVYLLDHGYYN